MAAIKMDELLVSWLSSDGVYENILNVVESQRKLQSKQSSSNNGNGGSTSPVSPTRRGGSSSTPTAAAANNKSTIDNPSGAPNSSSSGNDTEVGGGNTTNDPYASPASVGSSHRKGTSGKPPGSGSSGSPPHGGPPPPPPPPTTPPPPPKMIIPRFYNPQDGAAAGGGTEPIGGGTRRRKSSRSRFRRKSSGGGGGGTTSATAAAAAAAAASDGGTTDGGKEQDSPPTTTGGTGDDGEVDEYTWEYVNAHNPVLRQVFTSGQAAATSSTSEDGKETTVSSETVLPSDDPSLVLTMGEFLPITKDVCHFPSFFNAPLYRRILQLYGGGNDNDNNSNNGDEQQQHRGISYAMLEQYWRNEMEYCDDEHERFFLLVKKPDEEYITREDFLPFIEELLSSHPGLEFLSNHAEFQEKYAVTVITRIFYTVSRHGSHNGKITLRQLRRSNLLDAFHLVDTEEDINKVTQYFSYEHFYVLYCRFWELDHDRDYLITREDLLKYGDHSLSHMIVDRIFDAAPRPFESSSIANIQNTAAAGGAQGGEDGQQQQQQASAAANSSVASATSSSGGVNREYLSYEDFIYFMLSEEDKANEISVRYWFTCIDVDGDGRLNNMEMRSFYAVQLHRMQCLGHEIVPFEDMLCQMMDMIKPSHPDHIVVEDFLQPECAQVSGALFDALFNLNKYLQFEQRDPFMERQKREDEFDCDWDRFACIDYNRLAMEEEAREEEAMEIDWVTVDDDDDDGDDFNSLGLGGASEAPF